MRVSLTDRGFALLVMLVFLWASALALRDPLLALMAAGASLAPVLDFVHLLQSSRRLVLEVRGAPVQEVWVWEKPGFEVVAGGLFEPVDLPEWLKISGVEARGGALFYRFEATFRYSGVYTLEKLTLKVSSRLGIFELLEEVPVGVSFRVKPATLFWLRQALAILGIRGGAKGSVLESASPRAVYLRPMPEEYVGSREYVPGDSTKFIDWKATSRRRELFIKEFRGELGSQPLLVFDLRCFGSYTCDALASAILSLSVGLATMGIVASGVYDVGSNKFLAFGSPYGLVAYVVDRILESSVVEELDLYEYIEPPTFDEIRNILRQIAGLTVRPVNSATERITVYESIVYATALLHATSEVLDFASRALRRGCALSLVVPAEPWRDARSAAEAEVLKASFRRAIEKLSSIGVRVILTGESAPRTLVVETAA